MNERIAAGRDHTLVVNDNHTLYGCGDNSCGQLGVSSFFKVKKKKLRRFKLPPVLAVGAGQCFTIAVDDERKVWGCGSNSFGQLGTSEAGDSGGQQNVPKIVDANLPPIVSVSCGSAHSLFLDEEGFVWGTGYNKNGCLGLGDRENRKEAVKIPNLPPIAKIACGDMISHFVDTNGRVWSSGDYQLYNYFTSDTTSPKVMEDLTVKIKDVSCGLAHAVYLSENHKIIVHGNLKDTKLRALASADNLSEIEHAPPFNKVVSGEQFALYLSQDGSLWGSGKLPFGVWEYHHNLRKLDEEQPTFVDLAVGDNHALFVCDDGFVMSAGQNSCGCLGTGQLRRPKDTFNLIQNVSVSQTNSVRASPKNARNT